MSPIDQHTRLTDLPRVKKHLVSAIALLCLVPHSIATLAADGYPPPPGSYPFGSAWQAATATPNFAAEVPAAQYPGRLLPPEPMHGGQPGELGNTLFGGPAPTPSIQAAPPAPADWAAQYQPAPAERPPQSDFSIDFSRQSRSPAPSYNMAPPYQPGPPSYSSYPRQAYGMEPMNRSEQATYPATQSPSFPEAVLPPEQTHFADAVAQPTEQTRPPPKTPMFRPPELMAQ